MRRFQLRARRLLGVLAALGLASLAACKFDEVTVDQGKARPVVHLVLNLFGGRDIVLLLERTLTGRVEVREGTFDRDDPIVSGGGEPIVGARVVIRNVSGTDSGVAFDATETRTDGKGRGVYLLENAGCGPFYCPENGIFLSRGSTYRLEITTAIGEQVTATATIPSGFARPDTLAFQTFDVSGPPYVFRWPAAEGLRRYAVQVQTPYGPFQTFSGTESLAVNGSLRNFQVERIPRVFVPGFEQGLLALAVDRNYFDYFRSENNAFSGLGLVSHVQGGTGVFGAVYPIRWQTITVTGPFDDPQDGRWALLGDVSGFPPLITTYVEGEIVSGRLEDVFDPDFQTRRGLLGTRTGNTMRLAALRAWNQADTAWTLTAEVRGDTLVTTSDAHGTQRWLRRR